jgi:hypothetical protein
MLLALISLFQSTSPVPPPARPAPPAPPITLSSPARAASGWAQNRAFPRYAIDVDASAGGKTLWRGSLRLGAPGGANFQRTLTEAPPEGCATGGEPAYSGVRDSFRVQLNASSRDDEKPRQSFTVEWQRPADQCVGGVTTRTVQLSGSLQLKPGQSATVEGDAGLTLRFSRR